MVGPDLDPDLLAAPQFVSSRIPSMGIFDFVVVVSSVSLAGIRRQISFVSDNPIGNSEDDRRGGGFNINRRFRHDIPLHSNIMSCHSSQNQTFVGKRQRCGRLNRESADGGGEGRFTPNTRQRGESE
jgi:hypothetical protein